MKVILERQIKWKSDLEEAINWIRANLKPTESSVDYHLIEIIITK